MSRAAWAARWPYAVILLLALIQPLTHLWLQYGLSGEVRHSGFAIGDTPFFLTDMGIFTNDFYSPYVACESEGGSNNASLFALPHHWLYGALGWIASLLHLHPFLMLGIANGLGAAFYLLMALRFFRYVIPRRANLAFALFCFGGGLGGVAWLASLALGLQSDPGFELWFHRLARYELIEGPFLAPALIFPRLYYALPLGLGLAALMAFIGSAGREHPLPDKKAMVLQFVCAFLNARVGLLFWGVALCFMIAQPVVRAGIKWRYAILYLLPTVGAAMLVTTMFGMNVEGGTNFHELLRRTAWAGSLFTATLWAWPLVALALWRHVREMGWVGRLLAGWGIGYGTAYYGLYLAHQIWYGNLLAGGETSAAIAVSDWALLGLIPGSLTIFAPRRRIAPEDGGENWVALWLLGLGCSSIAAFGQGAFLHLMPERGLVLMGPALAILAADGIGLLHARFPRTAVAWTGLILVCGATSLTVSALCFQGPLGHTPGKSPFGWVHSEVVLAEDLAIIDRLPEGMVLAPASQPPLLSDVAVARRPKVKTVFGQPSLEFGDVNMLKTSREIQQFFAPDTSDVFRAYFVQDWCVEYIFCPATRPVESSVITELSALPWLERIAQEGDAVLFKVLIDTRPPNDG